ncbi:MAG: OmpA family protein [Acidobacteria bacterium]|nr:OmpA family protein [Acidobacteriota bacterium]MBI3422493.1 OmpA family protein [Acidobacteriota bacterium]
MKNTRTLQLLLAALTVLALGLPAVAQQSETTTEKQQQETTKTANRTAQVSAGQRQKISGVILRQEGDNLFVRDYQGAEYTVSVNNSTKLRERKSNPFRGAKKYQTSDLSRGLAVEVEGRGNEAGALVADQIKFSETELRTASSIVSMVTPVEGRVAVTENRVTMAEQNAQRLSGQLEELSAVANMANGGAKAAQETADKAMTTATDALSSAKSANERITTTTENLNNRITTLDDYEAAKTVTLNFKVGSAVLSKDAKAALDEIAEQAKTEKGFVIQVAGFASADGNEALNRRLSQRRAEAVMSYLIENHDISQRRIVTPLGFGEARPAADNATREGRKENRRVEVAILVNKGLTPATTTSSLTPQQ